MRLCTSRSYADGCRCEKEQGHDGNHGRIHSMSGKLHWWTNDAEAMPPTQPGLLSDN